MRVLPSGRPPSWIHLMATRYWDLQYTLAGMQTIRVPLIEVEGKAFGPSAAVDDVGGYYFIPLISRSLGLSLPHSVDVFFAGVVGLGLLVGVLGFLQLFRRWPARWIACAGMAILAWAAFRVGDVYSFFFATTAFAVPWVLGLTRRPDSALRLGSFCLMLGLLSGVANTVRSYSGTAALLFACGIVLFQWTANKRHKALVLLCLGVGLLVPKLVIARKVAERDAFLQAQCPGYSPRNARHVIWHSVYIGLGYLQNDYGIRWNDSVAYEKVQSIAPGTSFGSPEYERILRTQVLSIVRQSPWFVFLTLASKVGVVLLVSVIAANVGLTAAVVHHKPWPIEVCFAIAVIFNSLFAILVFPTPQYMLGLASFAALYGITSLGFFFEPRVFDANLEVNPVNTMPAAVA